MVIKKGWASLQLINELDLEDKLFHELPSYLLDEEGNPIVFDIEDQKRLIRLEYLRDYTKQPYVKAKRKAYNELPGMKEKVKQYNKEYYQRRKKEKNTPVSTKNLINGLYKLG